MTETTAERYDVLIVGLGPVGQSLAVLLGRLGRRVCVIEQYATAYGLPRAGHFDGEIMRIFQAAGIAEEMEILARPVFEYDLVDATGRKLHSVRFGQSGTGWKSDYLFYQPELEATLNHKIAELEGVEVHRSTRVVEVTQDAESVSVDAVTERGHPLGEARAERFVGRYLVGADGNAGIVRKALGLEFTDLGFEPLRYIVCDFKNANPDGNLLDFGEVRQTLDPARPALFGRWNGNRWSRWEFMVLPGEDEKEIEDQSRVWELVAPWGVTPDDGEFVRHKVYTFDARICESPRAGRAFLAGDAFHLMPPFMGQGMCSGIRDAMNLAWKLHEVLDGADESILETYAEERVPHALAITQMSMALAVTCTMTDPGMAADRDEKFLAGDVEEEGIPKLTGSLFSAGDNRSLLAGTLSPQGRVHRGRRTALLDDLIGIGWHLITRHPVDLSGLSETHRNLLADLDVKLAHVTMGVVEDSYLDIDGTYANWFRDNDVRVLLQRPDFYVFGTGQQAADLPALLDDLIRARQRTVMAG